MNVKITGPNGSSIFEADQVDYDKKTCCLRMVTAGVYSPEHLIEAGVNAYVTNRAGETIAKYEGHGRSEREPGDGARIEFIDGSEGETLSGYDLLVARGQCGINVSCQKVSRRDDGAIEYALQIGTGPDDYKAACLDSQTMVHVAAKLLAMVDIGPHR